ncbi:MAG: hypothetical protein JWM23_979 [Microbacteriaceae bacterium]|jgi:hypothetical protein|nr:hypothetical protein [Microbacteriaceae bacterium]
MCPNEPGTSRRFLEKSSDPDFGNCSVTNRFGPNRSAAVSAQKEASEGVFAVTGSFRSNTASAISSRS